MSKQYPFPPDEFDLVDPNGRPKEVHAARRSAWSRIWPFIVVVIVVPVVAFAVVQYLDQYKSPSDDNGAPSQEPVASQQSTPVVVSDPTPSSPVAEPVVSETPSQAAAATAEPPPLDRTTAVVIYNAKGESGLAGRATERLTSDSWVAVKAEDYPGTDRDSASAVYYAKKSQSTSAQAVADILHIDVVERDKKQAPNGGIAVVLRRDYVLE